MSNSVMLRPHAHGGLGQYSLAAASGVMAAGLAANSPIFSFRWGNTSNVALVESVEFSAAVAGTAFTAGVAQVGLIFARAFTVSDSVGTALTLTTNNAKRDTRMGTTLLTDARIADTVTLTAGTRTLDAQDLSRMMGSPGVATTGAIWAGSTLLWHNYAQSHPLRLVQDEGLIIRATVPATGIWTFAVTIHWVELEKYNVSSAT